MAGVQAEEAVFVDDVQANIDACEHIGMQGVLFREPQKAKEELKKLLKIK